MFHSNLCCLGEKVLTAETFIKLFAYKISKFNGRSLRILLTKLINVLIWFAKQIYFAIPVTTFSLSFQVFNCRTTTESRVLL